MSKLIEKLAGNRISRRDFLKGSALATAAVAGLSLVGTQNIKAEETKEAETAEMDNMEDGAKWVSAACWHNCGGRCLNKVLVKDGMILRQKTDDTHPDSWEYPQQRSCVRGHAQQQQCFAADRVKYPMKRKNWHPGGVDVNGELRGIDEWERISWEEAFQIVADETLRIKEQYGMEAFINMAAAASTSKMLEYLGGFSTYFDTDSFGTYTLGATMAGLSYCDLGETNDRFDLVNADTIVLYSSNPAWSAAALPSLVAAPGERVGSRGDGRPAGLVAEGDAALSDPLPPVDPVLQADQPGAGLLAELRDIAPGIQGVRDEIGRGPERLVHVAVVGVEPVFQAQGRDVQGT